MYQDREEWERAMGLLRAEWSTKRNLKGSYPSGEKSRMERRQGVPVSLKVEDFKSQLHHALFYCEQVTSLPRPLIPNL